MGQGWLLSFLTTVGDAVEQVMDLVIAWREIDWRIHEVWGCRCLYNSAMQNESKVPLFNVFNNKMESATCPLLMPTQTEGKTPCQSLSGLFGSSLSSLLGMSSMGSITNTTTGNGQDTPGSEGETSNSTGFIGISK